MKKKVLLSSALTIIICLCLIAGSTFALFTANDKFNIAVTAGEVAVDASAEISEIYSAEGVANNQTAEDAFLIDENDEEYYHKELGKDANGNWTFTNGGVVEMEGEGLKLSRLTPGDRVDVKINVANNSNVAINYRYKIFVNEVDENGDPVDFYLAYGMVLSVLEDDDATTEDNLTYAVSAYESFASYTSEWYYVAAPGGTAEEIETRMISVELPVYAGNEYQKRSVTYTVLVEAVQGNAVVHNEDAEVVLYQTEPVEKVEPTIDQSGDFEDPNTMSILHEDMSLRDDAYISVDKTCAGIVVRNIDSNVNGSAIVVKIESAPLILIYDCEFTLDTDEYIIDASACPGYDPMVFIADNVKVNGEFVNQATVGQYFKDVGYIGVFDHTIETN